MKGPFLGTLGWGRPRGTEVHLRPGEGLAGGGGGGAGEGVEGVAGEVGDRGSAEVCFGLLWSVQFLQAAWAEGHRGPYSH